ncbi:MAG: hypothetical protein ACFFG0_06390 [Candidatus Thorarchaeota archaeon]
MKIKISERDKFFILSYRASWLECKGSGTEDDPVIIEPSADLPKDFIIRNSNLYIHIKNCTIPHLTLEKCKNVMVEGCTLSICVLHKCLNITVKNSSISNFLTVYVSHGNIIEDVTINKLNIHHSNSNLVKKCKIDNIIYKFSKDNKFQGNIFPEKLLAQWRKQDQKKKKKKSKLRNPFTPISRKLIEVLQKRLNRGLNYDKEA